MAKKASFDITTGVDLQEIDNAVNLANKEIAADLDVGERTAKFHVAGLLKKMNATTRTEAVVRAARLGLLLL